MPSFGGSDDFLWIGAPNERSGALVVLLDEVLDGGLQGHHGMADAALELAAGQLGEEAFDGIQPSKARRPLIRSLKGKRPAGRGGDAEVGVK